jgi:hypothetical protein
VVRNILIYHTFLGIYALDHGNCTNKFAFGGGEGVVYVCSLISAK